MNALVTLESQLKPLAPRFAEVLGDKMPVERLMRTVLISVERLPALLDCDRQSIFNAAMSAAVLGLEVDGVTGQGYLIPFKGKAQLVIGYKGYNTLAARSGITITGSVVREGDAFDFDKGEGWVKHKPQLGAPGRRIIAAWAKASANGRPSVIEVLDVDELQAVKARSPGAKRSDSPWNDPHIGYPAMCEKTVKRRLARSMPLNTMQLAARMDEAFDEQGEASHIRPDRNLVIEGEIIPPRNDEMPTTEHLTSPRGSSPTPREAPVADPAPLSAAAPPGPGASGAAGEYPIPSGFEPVDKLLADAALKGMAALGDEWKQCTKDERRALVNRLDFIHKKTAELVDARGS
jgi:recombination protein RecT